MNGTIARRCESVEAVPIHLTMVLLFMTGFARERISAHAPYNRLAFACFVLVLVLALDAAKIQKTHLKKI